MRIGDIFSQKAVLENKLRNMEENLRTLEIAYKRELEANYRLAQKIAEAKPVVVHPDTSNMRECSRGRDKKIKTLKRKFKRQIEAERAMHQAAYALLDQKFSEHLDSLRVGVDIGSPEPDWKPVTLDMILYPVIELRDDGITIIGAASNYSFICSHIGCWNVACYAEVHNNQSTRPLYCEEHAMMVTADSDNFQLHRVECAG